MPEEQEPKVEGKKSRQPARPLKKEFMSKVAGLDTHALDIGNPSMWQNTKRVSMLLQTMRKESIKGDQRSQR
jgi:hypothetical protein